MSLSEGVFEGGLLRPMLWIITRGHPVVIEICADSGVDDRQMAGFIHDFIGTIAVVHDHRLLRVVQCDIGSPGGLNEA
jgi:hypothetical protein